MCLSTPIFWRERDSCFINVLWSMNKKKHLRMDSADCNNQNISFQDVMNMQFILLCNARGIARRVDGVSASVILPEEEQKELMAEERGRGRSG